MKTNPKMEALLVEVRDDKFDDPKALPQKLIALLNEGFSEEGDCVFLTRLKKQAQVQRLDFPDRTAYECFVNHVHVEDYLENGGLPVLELLGRGIALAREISARLSHLHGTKCFRIIITTDGSLSCTVRFHLVRPDEDWARKSSNGFKEEAVAIMETQELMP